MINILKLILCLLFFSDINLVFAYVGDLDSKDCYNFRKIGKYYCYKKKQEIYREKKQLVDNKKNYIGKYNRKSFKYKSYPTNTNIGFYTKKRCETNIDHVVSLKDAYNSGAKNWNNSLKNKFANDKSNHVPSCRRVNSSKGSSTPTEFLRKSSDGKGMDYKIKPFCSYLKIYYQVKIKYDLSFNNNNRALFLKCSLKINYFP